MKKILARIITALAVLLTNAVSLAGVATTNRLGSLTANQYVVTAVDTAWLRSATDNICHTNTYGLWVAHGVPEGFTTIGQPRRGFTWVWDVNTPQYGDQPFSTDGQATGQETNLVFRFSDYRFTATRHTVATSGQPFVTADNVPSTNGLVTASVTNGLTSTAAATNISKSVVREDVRTNYLCTVSAAQAMVDGLSSVYLKKRVFDRGEHITLDFRGAENQQIPGLFLESSAAGPAYFIGNFISGTYNGWDTYCVPTMREGYRLNVQTLPEYIESLAVTNGGAKAYADATFRTMVDNTCHANTFTQWVHDPLEQGLTIVSGPEFIDERHMPIGICYWRIVVEYEGITFIGMSGASEENALSFVALLDASLPQTSLGFRRDIVSTSNEPYVTPTYVTNEVEKTVGPVRDRANSSLVYSAAIYNYMNGNTNAWLSGTNYVIGTETTNRTYFAWEDTMDQLTVPCSMALWEIRDGLKQCVWDQRDWTVWYWNFKIAQHLTSDHETRENAIRALINERCPLAWSTHTACGVTNPASSTTWFDTPNVVLSSGYAWQHQLTMDGVGYWGIEGNGFTVGGSGTNAVLKITDWEGNEVMKIRKGNSRLVPITSESGVATGWSNNYMWFDMLCDVQPVGEFTVDLDEPFMEAGDTCPAEVWKYEDRGNGVWRCYFRAKSGIAANACFARFKVQSGSETTIEYVNAPTINGLIINGVKIAPEIPANHPVGTVITWKVVQ